MTPQEQHIDHIQKYLRGLLPPNEMKVMDANIQHNPILAQEVADYQFLIEGIEAVGASDFEAKVAIWESKYELKKEYLAESSEQQIGYSLDELLDMFRPVRAYENRIAKELVGTRHLGGLKVKAPVDKADFLEQITFELENPVNDVLKLSIENSEEDVVLKQNIAANTSTFTVDLAGFKPGRYYWKLRSKKYGMVIRSFFIQKKLMPPQA